MLRLPNVKDGKSQKNIYSVLTVVRKRTILTRVGSYQPQYILGVGVCQARRVCRSVNRQFPDKQDIRFYMGMSMLKGKDYMTGRQQVLVAEFEAEIESEYALCIAQIQAAKQAIEWATTDSTQQHQNLANSEIDALRKYWYARLEALITLVSWREPKLLQHLNEKYLKDIH